MTSAGMFFAGRPKEGLPGIFALSRAQSGSNRDGSVHENHSAKFKPFPTGRWCRTRETFPRPNRDVTAGCSEDDHCVRRVAQVPATASMTVESEWLAI